MLVWGAKVHAALAVSSQLSVLSYGAGPRTGPRLFSMSAWTIWGEASLGFSLGLRSGSVTSQVFKGEAPGAAGYSGAVLLWVDSVLNSE